MAAVNQRVRQIGHLRFERGTFDWKSLAGFQVAVNFLMLEQTFADFPCQVQSPKVRVFFLQLFHDAQALMIVFKPAVAAHQSIQDRLAFVAERRMAKVVRQRDGLRQVFV